jgi:hypothetical protein
MLKMNYFLRLSLVVLFIWTSFPLLAKDDKKKGATELGAFQGGVLYSLPRTGIRIFAEVTQEKFFHGPYFEFAQKYIGIKNAPSADGETWRITNLRLEPFGTPDPSEVHRANGAVSSMLSLSDEGVLLGINTQVKAEPAKVATTVFTPSVVLPKEIWPELSMNSYFEDKDSTRQSSSKVKSFEEKAAEAASDILRLRKQRSLILDPDYAHLPPDGKAYELVVQELNKVSSEYEALFIGKTFKASHTYVFEVVPDAKANKPLVAFRFSSNSGVMAESNIAGKPIMLELDSSADLTRSIESKSIPVAGETSANGLFYRTPGAVVARLISGSDVLAQARLSMAQFGVVSAFPDGLFSGDYSIELHPATGAIRRVGN